MKIYIVSQYPYPQHLIYPIPVFVGYANALHEAKLHRWTESDIYQYELTERFPEIPIDKVYYVKGIRYDDLVSEKETAKGEYEKISPAILFNKYGAVRQYIREEVKKTPMIKGVQISESYLSL
jgi:hypothetical protein